ncbi:MAG: YggU family protein [Chromatiales bacterium]|nr:YggU family protein [Chromatiales bacterium]
MLELHVVPGARKTAVTGLHGGRLKLAIASPPVDGRANAEVVRYLAELFGVAPRNVVLARGLRGRQKTVRVSAVQELPETLAACLRRGSSAAPGP